MVRNPTITDIAKECDVSLSTVSLVLNNNPRISEKTKQLVLDAVDKFGYQPNMQARALASKSSRTLSVVVPELRHVFSDIYFGEIVSGIYDCATEAGYKVMLDVANPKFVENREYLNLLKSRRADGMLFIASAIGDDYLSELDGAGYPFLLVNHYYPGVKLNHLMIDYIESAKLAAQHLLGFGHKRIGVIAGTNTYTGLDFKDSFIRTGLEHGLQESDMPWVDGGEDWSREGGFAATRNLFENNSGLTAIMAGNDMMAIGAMHYLQTMGADVPGDVSVMGMDDIPHAKYTTPSLTTVHHSLYKIGRLSCERVLAMFNKKIECCQEVLRPRLVVRESTATAKK